MRREIVRQVPRLFVLADQIDPRLAAARPEMYVLTPSLLAGAFRRKSVPRDPTDEPATALLQRIRKTARA